MPQTKIDVFSEGKTEESVMTQIAKRIITDAEFQERGGGGVDEMLKSLQQRLKDHVELQTEATARLNILVLRDWDEHLKQTVEFVREDTLSYIQPAIPNAALEVDSTHQNLFVLQSDPPKLKLVLHVATRKYESKFVKATIDDFVLELALQTVTLTNILAKKKKDGLKQKPPRDWQEVTEAQIVNKVTQEIPALLLSNKIPPLVEAKEYLRVYATILQEHISPAVIAGKILANAEEKDIRAVFASLLSAIQSLTAEN